MTILLLTTLTTFLFIIAVDSYSFRSSLNIRRPAQAKSISRVSCSVFRGNLQKRVPLTASAVNVPLAVSLPQASGQNWWIWSLLASTSSLGIVLENTKIGAMLSSPLVTMGMSLILCNLGVLPSSSPVYSTVLKMFVPLAVPLLLLDADLQKCFKSTGTLLKAFLIGSVGTFVGTVVAYMLVPMKGIVGSQKIAAALCARHIGGAVNFVAVSDILQTPPELVAAALAADNVVIAVYFAFLFSLCRSSSEEELLALDSKPVSEEKQTKSEVNLRTMSIAVAAGLIFCAVSETVGKKYSVSPMLLVSTFAVMAATLFPTAMGAISASGGIIGVLAMQMFFAVTGAMGHIPTVLKMAPTLFLHTFIQIVVHFTFSVSFGKIFKLPLREIVLASNANVGGPTTAAAMASSKKWKQLVLPALLTGIFGYAIATGLGLLVAKLLPLVRCL